MMISMSPNFYSSDKKRYNVMTWKWSLCRPVNAEEVQFFGFLVRRFFFYAKVIILERQ